VSRRSRIAAVLAAVAVFVLVSVLLARLLGAATAARNQVTKVIKLQVAGDAIGVVDRIEGCAAEPPCAARTAALVRRLRTPGRVQIVRIDNVAGFALGSRTDTARVVWRAGRRLPTVQCVRVRREGSPFTGYEIKVLSVSPPIGREDSC
jgi:hypothetical protein